MEVLCSHFSTSTIDTMAPGNQGERGWVGHFLIGPDVAIGVGGLAMDCDF